MLTSLLGVRLIFWMGATIPRPAGYDLTRALTSVEVTNDAEAGDGFQLTFTLAKSAVVDYGLLASGQLEPFTRVIIGVLMGVVPQVLIDGIITHQQVSASDQPGRSTLTVTGRDVSVMLDLEEKDDQFENQPDSVIVTRVLASYAQYGLVPAPAPTVNVPLWLDYIPRQHETDLQLLRRLAERNGFVFYIEPLTFGVNTAYWGPENRLGVPQPAITVNMGARSNAASIGFANDALAPVQPEGSFVVPILRTAVPIPPLPSLRIPPLVPAPAPARRTVRLRQTANQNPGDAATSAVATTTRTPDPVTGEGELDAVRYGTVLRARRLVGVRGAGFSYDGLYYVRKVTHTVARGEYRQRFTISREGTGSLLPVLPP
jgi:hypothetical protein